ncbi:MAG: low specificity L-threonine aldolase [Mesorhizobium sp.]|nr:low specificity L-threonine aldolase [Mesorhizobium sp.]
MIFSSDNWAGAHPRIAQSLVANAGGYAAAYGASDLDRKVADTFSTVFERDVAVFFVATGTAANSLAMAACNRPGGVAFCHSEAHMIADECGAPEYFTGGARLCPVPGDGGRMEPAALEAAIARYPAQFVHSGQPMAVSITQATEIGTAYALDEIDAIAAVAHGNGLPLHMDGARFANALVALDATPAEMTWKRGIDLVSFGGTKNGCWCAEALVVLDPAKAGDLPFLRKRAAQLFSKSRFIAAQFDAYFEDGLWLDMARHANAMGARLADGFRASNRVRLGWEPHANEVFAIMPVALMQELTSKGAQFYPWATPAALDGTIAETETLTRYVTSFATTTEDIEELLALIR